MGKFMLLISLLSVFITTCNGTVKKSAVRYYNMSSAYSASWYTYSDPTVNSGAYMIRLTLQYVGFDKTSWSTQGNNGIWLGIGYG